MPLAPSSSASPLLVLTLFFSTMISFLSAGVPHGFHTPLLHDEMPCVAENIQDTDHYLCNDDHEIICLSGWTDVSNLCRTPVCEFATAGSDDFDRRTRTCGEHGDCVRPNVCACDVGWEGIACDSCVRKPGCQHGYCEKAFDCICANETAYRGADCDVPICREGCQHGYCIEPGECICQRGWTGERCDECMTLPGCQHGSCRHHPLECACDEGWVGPMCDCPVCRDGCDMHHGFCTNEGSVTSECLCYPGWRGPNCTECIAYPGCPLAGTCEEPWECNCPEGVQGEFCQHDRRHNTLPEYHHHDMSTRCRNVNRFIQNRKKNGQPVDPSDISIFMSAFPDELVYGKADNVDRIPTW